jgi:hypothetical protein
MKLGILAQASGEKTHENQRPVYGFLQQSEAQLHVESPVLGQ